MASLPIRHDRAADRRIGRCGAEGGAGPLDTQAHPSPPAAHQAQLGAALALLIALYSATSGVKTLFEALNIAYEEEETRSFLRLNITAFGFTVVAVIGVAAAIAVIVGLPVLLAYLPLGPLGEWLARIGFWILLVAMPSVRAGATLSLWSEPCASELAVGHPRVADRRHAVAGVIRCLLLLVPPRVRYLNRTYGTLGGVVILLIWLYISAFVILLGAELNAEAELQTQRDTTTGPPMPMGRRQAYVADHTAEQRRRRA